MSETILLCPRPLARYAGRFLLLPLLPHQPPLKPLPSEIWTNIFSLAVFATASEAPQRKSADGARMCFSLMLEVALPLLYSHVQIRTVSGLDKFTSRLYTADQKWDSIRRIPYSTPGRWVQTFDLSEMAATLESRQGFMVDSLLTRLFPLMPFLAKLSLSSALPLSRRALSSLTNRDGNSNLRSLGGICYDVSFSSAVSTGEDPFVQLLQKCHNLERLEIIGNAIDPIDLESYPDGLEVIQVPALTVKLNLPRLHSITLLSMPSSSLMYALLSTSLPRLRALSITPYDDIPYPGSFTSKFLDIHGKSLSTLSFFTPKSWPTRLHPSPCTLFHTCPNLRHLSLEYPLPVLILPASTDSTPVVLPLQILSIPRPNGDFWRTLERLLPSLPSLKAIRTRDIRWLRRGMTNRAQEAGVQGEMRDWRRRLARRGIRLLDGDWKETP
ncbi:hypothetical protein HYDPIDRAFT_89048 [Hydnomerulius pinastri MD-312]|uniref:F-box domain-containing protein n=1 Tax=Hydnomerulius pinastri MD-312 TaxID=994086 RepID=A0A0C9WFR6_9AGAM|nr:hypothetical protein HYDPIDRAFT_89048 [Hydnomerulius pinastri MD-312]